MHNIKFIAFSIIIVFILGCNSKTNSVSNSLVERQNYDSLYIAKTTEQMNKVNDILAEVEQFDIDLKELGNIDKADITERINTMVNKLKSQQQQIVSMNQQIEIYKKNLPQSPYFDVERGNRVLLINNKIDYYNNLVLKIDSLQSVNINLNNLLAEANNMIVAKDEENKKNKETYAKDLQDKQLQLEKKENEFNNEKLNFASNCYTTANEIINIITTMSLQ